MQEKEIFTDRSSDSTSVIQDKIGSLRGAIIDTTSEIQTTDPEIYEKTSEFQTNLLKTVADYEDNFVDEKRPASVENISIESLYKTFSTNLTPSNITRIIEIINECKEYIDTALENYDDEITRENQMSLLLSCIYEFDYFQITSQNLYDLIAALKFGLFAHRITSYKREEIQGIRSVFDLMRKNIFMPDDILDKCIDILETNNIEVSAPFAKIELDVK